MSGGSYEYLCWKTAEELVNRPDLLEKMAARLAELGYAEDAARETEDLLCIVRQYTVRAQTRIDRLSRLWQSVEWWDSHDWSEDVVKRMLKGYRGEES